MNEIIDTRASASDAKPAETESFNRQRTIVDLWDVRDVDVRPDLRETLRLVKANILFVRNPGYEDGQGTA